MVIARPNDIMNGRILQLKCLRCLSRSTNNRSNIYSASKQDNFFVLITAYSNRYRNEGGVKSRARVFTEGIMIMVCPVLLAILRGSAQSKIEKNKILGEMTHAIAGATLLAGILQFVVICLPKTVINWACGVSKFLIHACIVLVMGLASLVMTLVGLKGLAAYVTAVVIIGFSSLVMGYMSCREDRQESMNNNDFEKFKCSIDVSANFSAAVTAILFLGLEALALEGLMKGDSHRLNLPLGWSFATCGIGVLSMLLVSVHPLIYDKQPSMTYFLQVLSVALGIFLCTTVYFFTGAAVGKITALAWLSPSLLPPGVWICLMIFPPATQTEEDHEPQTEEEHEPASLELTKITFGVFLAVSITANDNSIGDCTLFLCWTALAIFTGVQWRLMTHWKKVSCAVARAADTACFISHGCMACAVIPFAILAAEVMKKPGELAKCTDG